jgi:hypothetical protein
MKASPSTSFTFSLLPCSFPFLPSTENITSLFLSLSLSLSKRRATETRTAKLLGGSFQLGEKALSLRREIFAVIHRLRSEFVRIEIENEDLHALPVDDREQR